jgi:hypothetical protein
MNFSRVCGETIFSKTGFPEPLPKKNSYTKYYLILPIVPGGTRNRVAGVRRVKPIRNWYNNPILRTLFLTKSALFSCMHAYMWLISNKLCHILHDSLLSKY